MSIVSESNVHDALAYLAQHPHPLAEAQFELTKTENELEALFAELYLKTEGTVKERECLVIVDNDYREHKFAVAESAKRVLEHKQRVKAAESLLDIWRTENANARAAEKIR